jgi:hypothetical protein
MITFIQNLRIGTKLGITSALSILLVAAMIYLQMTGGAEVRKANDGAIAQESIAQNAAEAKASIRGMQVAIFCSPRRRPSLRRGTNTSATASRRRSNSRARWPSCRNQSKIVSALRDWVN